MNRAFWPEGVKCKSECHIVGNVDETAIHPTLDDDVPDIATCGDRVLVEGRCLSGFPCDNEIAAFDATALPYEQ